MMFWLSKNILSIYRILFINIFDSNLTREEYYTEKYIMKRHILKKLSHNKLKENTNQ